ncbi:MAG: hypothetical protein F4186_12980 [Boseongicola sp. SB0676_bin_33]|nr:hypothetical protein [Boseongicola sp. SB0676_bin_33]MYK30769.1 hypothetical protein [Boseongicola sp. SB0670_bin_30]
MINNIPAYAKIAAATTINKNMTTFIAKSKATEKSSSINLKANAHMDKIAIAIRRAIANCANSCTPKRKIRVDGNR